ncbi:MAG: ATP synthase F1 subunit epsilon [Bacteriovoracaceae bacterium]
MSYFKVDILTPAGVVDKNIDATSVVISTVRGEIAILPEHTHLITELAPGIMTVKTDKGDRHFFLTTGIAKILKSKVTILAHTSEKAETIDKERAQRALVRAKEKLSGKEHLMDLDQVKYRRKLERAEYRIKAAMLR